MTISLSGYFLGRGAIFFFRFCSLALELRGTSCARLAWMTD